MYQCRPAIHILFFLQCIYIYICVYIYVHICVHILCIFGTFRHTENRPRPSCSTAPWSAWRFAFASPWSSPWARQRYGCGDRACAILQGRQVESDTWIYWIEVMLEVIRFTPYLWCFQYTNIILYPPGFHFRLFYPCSGFKESNYKYNAGWSLIS